MKEDDPRRARFATYLKEAKEWGTQTTTLVEDSRQLLSMRPPDADAEFEQNIAATKQLKDDLATLSTYERRELERLMQSIPWGLNPLIPPPPPRAPEGVSAVRRHSRPNPSSVHRPRTIMRPRRRRQRGGDSGHQ